MIRDYKGKDTHKTLGLKRGKDGIKRGISPRKPRKIFVWAVLFAMVAVVNYLVFVHLGPLGKTEITIGRIFKENTSPDTFEEWFNKAYRLHQDENLVEAADAYTKAIALRPDDTRSYFNRGVVYVSLGKHDKAIEDFNWVIARQADYAEAYYNRGRVYLHRGLYDRVIQDCDQALLLDPGMAPAYITRGMAYKAKGFVDMAKSDFQKSCKLGHNDGCRAYGELATETHRRP